MANSFGFGRLGEVGLRHSLGVMAFGIAASAMADSPRAPEPAEGTKPGLEQAGSSPNHLSLGLGMALLPDYQGADDYQAEPVPLVDARYGRWFARTGEGVGVTVIDGAALTAGISVNWMRGYEEDDLPEGIEEVDDALGARLFVSTRRWGTQASLAVTRAVTETERGLLAKAELSYPWEVSERLMIAPGLGVTWADENYMVSYFGVDATEAARSGFSEYRPGAGFKDASFRIRARYRISERVSVVGAAGVIHLLDDAADAPLTDEDTQAVAVAGFVYRF